MSSPYILGSESPYRHKVSTLSPPNSENTFITQCLIVLKYKIQHKLKVTYSHSTHGCSYINDRIRSKENRVSDVKTEDEIKEISKYDQKYNIPISPKKLKKIIEPKSN